MYLGDGCGSQRCFIEFLEQGLDFCGKCGLYALPGQAAGEWRYIVLQTGQFQRDIVRQQVLARRQDLAELDIDRPQFFQCVADAYRACVASMISSRPCRASTKLM